MTINLTPSQIAWLKELASERGYASLDEAAQAIVAEAMLHSEDIDLDNLDWVKPLLDEAREDIAQGRVISGDEFHAHMDARIARLKGK